NPKNAIFGDCVGVGTIDPPYLKAKDDALWTSSSTVVGNVLVNDVDPSAGGLRVSAVNSSAANVGSTIQLASGALLTVNPDGSFVYNPNGAFNWVGCDSAYDTFTYTITDSLGAQSTATVTIRIDGYCDPGPA